MFSILNRWRGTGKIIGPVSGNIVYALVIGFIFVFLTDVYYSFFIGFALFILGEATGWGKWVGTLCYININTPIVNRIADKEGYSYPWIHRITELFIKEDIRYKKPLATKLEIHKHFIKYCWLALSIRGFYWWIWIYMALAYFEVITYGYGVLISILLGISFPIACYISNYWDFTYKSKWISIDGNWEKQEIIYGFLQGIPIWYLLIGHII